mgnify:CR=1 FL=1
MSDSWTMYASTKHDGLVEVHCSPPVSPITVEPARILEEPKALASAEEDVQYLCCWNTFRCCYPGLYALMLMGRGRGNGERTPI